MQEAVAVDDDAEVLEHFSNIVARDMQALALLHAAEPDAELLEALRASGFPRNLGLGLDADPGPDGSRLMGEALTAMADGADPASQAQLDELAVDYADTYLCLTHRASPCESFWLDEENLERQEPMFQVREYYRRHGLGAADWRKRSDDHLVLQLQFLAHLIGSSSRAPDYMARLGEAARFMDDHLLRWLPQFSQRVASRCATRFFAGLACITEAYCEELRDLLAEILADPRPEPETVERRMKPRGVSVEVPLPYVPGLGPSV